MNHSIRNTAVLVSIALLGTLSAACGARSGGAPTNGGGGTEYTLRIAHNLTPQSVKGRTATTYEEILEEETDGRIQVKVFPNGEISGDKGVVQAVQRGAAQMAFPTSADTTGTAPALQVLDLPYLFEDYAEVRKKTSPDTKLGQLILENDKLAEKNIKVVGVYAGGFKQLSANQPVRTLDDMDGLRVRIQPADVLASQYRAWGASPVQMSDFGEVYTALEQGVIDGQENPYSTIYSESVYEVQDYIMELDHGFIAHLGIINHQFFNSLPTELQQDVVKAAGKLHNPVSKIAKEESKKAKNAILQESDTKVIEFSETEKESFKSAVVPSVWKEYADVIGEDVLRELLAQESSPSSE